MSTVDRTRYEDIPGAYVGYGGDADVDAAFDDAAQSARDEYGHLGVVPTVADADPSSVQERTGAPLSLESAAVRAVRHLREGVPAGEVHAIPVAADTQYKRRKVRVNVDDPALDLGRSSPGPAELTPELEARIRAELAEQGVELQDDETIEKVEVQRLRSRYKPEVTVHKGTKERAFQAIVRETGALVGEGKTAGEARRAAVTAAKEGTHGTLETYTIDVYQQVRVEGSLPLIEVKRERVLQKGALRVTLHNVKNPEKHKTTGWLFYGTAGPASETKESAAPE